MRRHWALAWLLLGCGGDPEPLTQLVLVADSDIAELDRIAFEVRGPPGYTRSAIASRTAGGGPSFVSLVREDGPLDEVVITATGLQSDDKVVLSRVHEVSFVPGQTRVVELDLYADCVGVKCPGEETCRAQTCTKRKLKEEELPLWQGEPATPFSAKDAGVAMPDASSLLECGAPMPVDTSKDPMNCGGCGIKCMAMQRCTNGACVK